MAFIPNLDRVDLASLLSSRICHDIISPVGAISNALELFDESNSEDTEALDLIRLSAAHACAKIQYARLAFGASGGVSGEIDIGEVEKIARNYMENERASLTWHGSSFFLSKIEVKFLLNLLLVANASIPRGGAISVSIVKKEEGAKFILEAEGSYLRVMPKFDELQNNLLTPEEIDAYSIQPYYTLLLAHNLDLAIKTDVLEHKIIFST